MKIYAHKNEFVTYYKGYRILYDDSTGCYCVYFRNESRDKVEFDSDEEAFEYIDDLNDESDVNPKFFDVWYINSIDNQDHIQVEAIDEQDARKIAKNKLGKECYHITNVYDVEENR